MELTREQLEALVVDLAKQVAALSQPPVNGDAVAEKVQKNHRPVKPSATRNYVLLSKSLNSWGKVPAQQAEIAKVIANNFEVGVLIPEAKLFAVVEEAGSTMGSFRASMQSPSYVFTYYRGLGKKDGKHAGYIARDFLRMVE